MSARQAAASSRLLNKLNTAIEEKKYYEGHQLIKTLNFRYNTNKKHEELEELLVKYSALFFEENQYESGIDVSLLLSNLYVTAKLPVTEKRIDASIQLLGKMRSGPERSHFLHGIFEWAKETELVGKVHAVVAKLYITEKEVGDAWKHVLRMNDGKEAGSLTLEIIESLNGYLRIEEIDLVIGHLIVSFLARKKIALAEAAYTELIKDPPEQDWPFFNGIRYLIEAAKRNDAQIFEAIQDFYEPSFSRDPKLSELITSAGKALFNLPDAPTTSNCSCSNNGGVGIMPMLISAILDASD